MNIENNEVHIWHVELDINNIDIDALSEDEYCHASDFKSVHDQDHFLRRRYLLRVILSRYCHCLPNEIKFKYTRYKKPYIFSPKKSPINFNISFSDNLMIVGITNGNDIGVDIEKIRNINDMENVAFDHFSDKEFSEFKKSSLLKEITFFTIWTKKEAFIKATGKGLFYPLKSFTAISKHLNIHNRYSNSCLWRLDELNTREGYIASLAVKMEHYQISYFSFSDNELKEKNKSFIPFIEQSL